MGEVVLSSEELMEKKNEGMVKWESFLQGMALRVLLVEADDSTRQIITALLRKSTYRVTAVPDGLKAWEILRGRPHNIDLILTEVDLPSISGFALLTLIMEHEICKNIPVIMMSSQDSVSTVYKCMLRGAADYLVKPVRRNELRNLWQHVWRRQSSTIGGNVDQDESVGQQKIEATSENDAASNHSSGHVACIQRNEECIEKGSDAQSSCTKPDFEAESAQMEEMQDFSRQVWGKSLQNDVKMPTHEGSINYSQQIGGSVVAAFKDANDRNLGKDVEPESQRKDVTFTSEVYNVLVNSSREAIDFMGAYKNQNSSSNNGTSKVDSSPDLDLSLRRSHPSGFENHVSDQRFTIKHSNASAFTRYTNRPLQPLHSTLHSAFNQQKEFATDSEKNLSDIATISNSDTPLVMPSTKRSVSSLATSQSKQFEVETLCPQHRASPVPIPVKGMLLNSLCTGYGSVLPHIFCAQSGLSPMPSPSSANQQEPTFQVNPVHCGNVENSNCSLLYDRLGENAINSINQTVHMLSHRLETLEDRGHISPATDQSASGSFCNGAISRLNSMRYGSTCGSNSNVDQVPVGRAAAESKNEEGFCPSNGNSHRSIEREAALTKFRLKRKDRCYDKKVRYESRKKLAEQRPRVKGQFVRQAQPDPTWAESENQCGNSLEG
ncbi:two-component response regulator-like APRR5 isoform X2 [Pistacia vera]|uniref:two-component response regulator-like APRR5 isoform X2 n=1 Tax=Pistacia vera TaxID=55513 RepID=UPI001262E3EC|nr:two-component response regulator-like APRR5 isoform X2 [Pistacia vera]